MGLILYNLCVQKEINSMPKFTGYDDLEKHEKLYSFNYKEDEILYGEYALSNEFVRLPKKIDLQPLKILGLILSKIDFKKDNRVNGVVEVNCSLSEIRKACGANKDNKNYEYYKNIVKELIKTSYVEGVINNNEIMGYAVPMVETIPNEELITFKFTLFSKFLPYFQQLRNNYTVIQLEQAKRFKSRFSYNLFMNLLSWKEKDNVAAYRFYTTKQLKDLFGLEKDDYCKKNGKFNRYEFEKKTIETACNEINEHTNMRVEWKKNYLSNSNRVSNYQFEFVVKE